MELLVACAVLALLVAILASAFSGFASLISSSTGRLESSDHIRTVFDRLAFDLGASVRNDDVHIEVRKNASITGAGASNNDSLAVLVDARSTSTESRFARIGYEIGRFANAATKISGDALVRCVEPFLWTDDPLSPSPSRAATSQPIGAGIFRIEVGFLKTDGTVVATPPSHEDIAALIVAAAAVDEGTLSKMTEAQVNALAGALPDAVDGKLPMESWNAGSFAALSLPAAQAVRFYQRYFYLR